MAAGRPSGRLSGGAAGQRRAKLGWPAGALLAAGTTSGAQALHTTGVPGNTQQAGWPAQHPIAAAATSSDCHSSTSSTSAFR